MTTTNADTDERVAQLTRALSQVKDPCSLGIGRPLGLLDMGLVGQIDISDCGWVKISLVLTQPDCWFFFDITKHIEEACSSLEWVSGVEVEMDSSTIWTPDRHGVDPIVSCASGDSGNYDQHDAKAWR